MLHLSQRLLTIADCVKQGESIADIGTDHGLLPIFLWQHGICAKAIMTDVNEGPLEKARYNISRISPDMDQEIRRGNGLQVLNSGEVDTVMIAGRGGLLMRDILDYEVNKTRSFSRFILQPRNKVEDLRKWLFLNGFIIENEHLVVEGNYICEIIEVNTELSVNIDRHEIIKDRESRLEFEISPILFKKRDPLLKEFIERKIAREEYVIEEILEKGSVESKDKVFGAKKRLEKLQNLIQIVNRN